MLPNTFVQVVYMLYVKLEVGIGQKFVNRLIGHFFSTINRLIVENMLHNANNKIY